MTAIRDVLAPYYSPTAPGGGTWPTSDAQHKYELLFFGAKLAGDMDALGRAHDGWKFFNYLWRQWDGRLYTDTAPVHPDTLVDFCAYFGVPDAESLTAWVDAQKPLMGAGIAEKIATISNRPFDVPGFDSLPTIQFQEFVDFLRTSGAYLTPDVQLHAKDDFYRVLKKSDLIRAYKQSPLRFMIYKPEAEDCDKFESAYKSFFGEHGVGNVAIADTEISLWMADGTCIGAHDVCAVVYDDDLGDGLRKAALFEPQTGDFHGLTDVWGGGGIAGQPVRNEIYWLTM